MPRIISPSALALRLPPRARTVSPAWMRRNVVPAYNDTWNHAEAMMLADPHESQLLDELAVELTANGIERPVSVYFDHWWSLRLTVADGMHRTVAAMRLGIDIPIALNYMHWDSPDHSDVYLVSAASPVDDDFWDALLSLSSFRSGDGTWIQSDCASGGGGSIEISLPAYPHRRDAIAAELENRLRGAGIGVKVAFLGDFDTLDGDGLSGAGGNAIL